MQCSLIFRLGRVLFHHEGVVGVLFRWEMVVQKVHQGRGRLVKVDKGLVDGSSASASLRRRSKFLPF